MNTTNNNTPVDIKTLIQTSNIDNYNQTKLVNKLKHHFDEEEQRLYVAKFVLIFELSSNQRFCYQFR